MLPKIAHISPLASPNDMRSAERRVITFGFSINETGRNTRILVLNLSRSGMLLQTSADLDIGEKIQVEIPEAGPVNARIVRRTGNQFGAMFDNPITKAALSAVLLASPAGPPPLDREEIRAAHRAYPSHEPVPEWLLWSVLTITSLAVALFVYSLTFLPIVG